MSSELLKELISVGHDMWVSLQLSDERPILTFGSRNSQDRNKGAHRFLSFARLRLTDHEQYYTLATTALFFYDYVLTLEDEVSHPIHVAPR